MMAIDCVWVTIFGFYLEMVMPKTFGRRRHPCFCFTRSFWGCNATKRTQVGQVLDEGNSNNFLGKGQHHETVDQTLAFETKFLNPDCYEKLSPEIDQKEHE